MTGPRDWDKELAEIDKAIARLPARPAQSAEVPAAAGTPAGSAPSPAGARTVRPAASPRETTTTWLRVVLAVVLAAALPFWTYSRGCGLGLYLYLGASAVVVIAGLWAAGSAWQRRRARAHIVALLVVLWGLGLIAHEVLPRIGYAKQPARWTCG
ncbi:MAG TPA: hypothetical protein VFS11_08925 [Gemmatimonadales bacterium]|nr:hypothetical protein [Gemmatimonadales bacterium]